MHHSHKRRQHSTNVLFSFFFSIVLLQCLVLVTVKAKTLVRLKPVRLCSTTVPCQLCLDCRVVIRHVLMNNLRLGKLWADVCTYTFIRRTKLYFPLLNFLEGMSVGLRAYNTGHKMATHFTERCILIAINQKIGSE